MIADYRTLMRHVRECASSGEVRISEIVELIANRFWLAAEGCAAILPSGKRARFTNRVNWAKSYLKQQMRPAAIASCIARATCGQNPWLCSASIL